MKVKVIDSPFKDFIRDTYFIKEGTLYIFDDFVITEIKENAILDEDYVLFLYQILEVYGADKPQYGVISNRINDYTINVSDFIEVIEMANKQFTTAIVIYDKANKRRAKFESCLYHYRSRTFKTLENAAHWMKSPSHQKAF